MSKEWEGGRKGEGEGREPHPAAVETSTERPKRRAALLGLGTAESQSFIPFSNFTAGIHKKTQLTTQEWQQRVMSSEARKHPRWHYLLTTGAVSLQWDVSLWFYITNLLLFMWQTAGIATFSFGRCRFDKDWLFHSRQGDEEYVKYY